MTSDAHTQVLVVGAGPGGYAAAIRCGQLGLETTLVEKGRLGGTCLTRGCIPSKAVIHAADEFAKIRSEATKSVLGIGVGSPTIDFARTRAWKDGIVDQLSGGVGGLLTAAGVTVIEGTATMVDGKTVAIDTEAGALRISADNVILAPGSTPVELPFLPFGGAVLSSTDALNLDTVPDHLVVVGAGYIGLELGTAFAKLGSHVTFVEMGDRILPAYDADLTKPVAAELARLGATTHLNARATSVQQDAGGATLQVTLSDGSEVGLHGDHVLVTVGRKPRTEGWGRENLVLDMDGPFIKVDEQCRTSMRGIFAVGDVTGEPMLAHRATAQGEVVAEILAGHRREFVPAAIPAVVFTDPEIVVVGRSESEATAAGFDAIVGRFPLAANGRNLSLDGSRSGFVRVVAERSTGLVLGVQIVGTSVAELQGVAVTALEMAATLDDLTGTIQAHPSLGEAITEAALMAQGRPLHLPLPPLSSRQASAS